VAAVPLTFVVVMTVDAQNFDNCRMHLSLGFDSGYLIGVNPTSKPCCRNCFRHDGDLNWLALYDRITFGFITLPKY